MSHKVIERKVNLISKWLVERLVTSIKAIEFNKEKLKEKSREIERHRERNQKKNRETNHKQLNDPLWPNRSRIGINTINFNLFSDNEFRGVGTLLVPSTDFLDSERCRPSSLTGYWRISVLSPRLLRATVIFDRSPIIESLIIFTKDSLVIIIFNNLQ